MTKPITGKEERHCPTCGKRVYYGIFCLYTDCFDVEYERWKKNEGKKYFPTVKEEEQK